MPGGQYPFIDIAVHEQIRSRFALGEALVLFTPEFDEVLWADSEGSKLFGFASPYELMDDWSSTPSVTHRQLRAAASGLVPGDGRRAATLRLARGLRSRVLSVGLLSLRLADGRLAVLLVDEADADALDPARRAERIVAGLGDDATHVAAFGAGGSLLASSAGFDDLSLDPASLGDLIAQTTAPGGRLTKRMIVRDGARLPAAIARLSDDPALYLVFVLETQGSPADEGDLSRSGDAIGTAAVDDGHRNGAGDHAEALHEGVAPHDEHSDSDEVGGSGAGTDIVASAQHPGFVFQADGKPVRFVWKIDAQGRFKELSPEFPEAVGPNAADIIGRRFEDVARVFGFDRDGRISTLLERRDTWSGRTISWPVQGTDLSVPVELAALPTYTANREFDGFRGFGIIRISEAEKDPEAIGLSLVPQARVPAAAPPQDDATGESDDRPAERALEGGEATPETAAPDEHGPGDAAAALPDDEGSPLADPFQGEKPALKIVRPFGRRHSDKVIDLEQRRPRTRELLSSLEQQAFREIGERLAKSFGPERKEEPRDGTEASAAEPSKPVVESDGNERAAPVAGETGPEVVPADPAQGRIDDAPGEAPLPADPNGSPFRPAALPSAFATSGVASARQGLSEDIVDDLPIAVLLHNGETLHHANREFFSLTGYSGLDALREAGGLTALFDAPKAPAGSENGDAPGTLRLRRAGGGETSVLARLKSVNWQGERALMLSLLSAAADEAADMEGAQARTPSDEIDEAAAATPGPNEMSGQPHDPQKAALKIEVEELRSILETATDGVVILGENGEIRSMNRSASALFDYDESETRGQPFAKLFAHESQRAVMDYLNGLREHGVASVLNDGREVIGREASGGFLPLFMTIGRLTGSNGYCAVMRDITQWKRTEEELRTAKSAAEQANAHKSEFLARVSHEIRTPLNAIIGFSEMMAEQRFGPIGSPRYLEYAHDIGQSGKHVLDIVNDLLDISKIEAGEMEVSFTAVALNEAIAEAVALLQPQANSQRVIIRTSLSSAVPEVVADQRSIKQIALNLLANAIRFTPAGGQIVVSTAYEATGSVVLRIRDTGVGMSRAELDQAMKPFRQVKGSTSRPRGDGTGLGLPLTKAMVEANRAEFDIRSAPSEGTLVEITFPSQRVLAD